MPIIEPNIQPGEYTRQAIKQSATKAYQHLVDSWKECYNLLWNNPYGLTPQEVLDAFGTEAVQAFLLSANTGEFINQLGAGVRNAVPEGYTYTANPDGTITLQQVEPPAPSAPPVG